MAHVIVISRASCLHKPCGCCDTKDKHLQKNKVICEHFLPTGAIGVGDKPSVIMAPRYKSSNGATVETHQKKIHRSEEKNEESDSKKNENQ